MKHLISKLLAVVAAAVLCLSPVALATAASAASPDDPDIGYALHGGVELDEIDPGYARNGGVVPPEPDLGFARNGDVVPDPPPAPTTFDTGYDADDLIGWGAAAVALAAAGVGGTILLRRRHDHVKHVAHTA